MEGHISHSAEFYDAVIPSNLRIPVNSICKTNREALTVLCSVVNRLGSGESTQEDLAASTEQSTVKASLFVK